jgi:hypothetical protein
MERLTIGQAVGRRVTKPDASYIILERYDPFTRTWSGSGYDAPHHDSIYGMMTNESLLTHGIEIVPSVEELAKIEELRLSNKVKKAASELSLAISEWLGNPVAR